MSLLFVLGLIPLLGIIALAVDFSATSRLKTNFNAAADAAALVAVSASLRAQDKSVAQAQAERAFHDNLDSLASEALTGLTVTITDTNGERLASVSYSATYSGGFGGSFGLPGVSVSNEVIARGPAATYIDFYLMLDNSPSMGLAATQADIDIMTSNLGCAFACHELDQAVDSYAQAKALGVKLRIDVVRSATQSLMDTAGLSQIVPGQFRMALYTFGSKAETAQLTELAALTSNHGSVKSAANQVDLMSLPYNLVKGDALTDFAANFNAINARISSPGTGLAGSAPQKVLFFVSDGVNNSEKSTCSQTLMTVWDQLNSRDIDRCHEPLNTALCDAIKARGIKIAVLYTTYLPLPGESMYEDFVKPYIDKVGSSMKACASDGLYFEVSPSQGVAEAMQALFIKTITSASLTR